MSTLLEIYHQLCTEDRLPETRRKNFLASLRYLAASYETAPDDLRLTPELEASYQARLRDYLTAQGKTPGAIRNAIQEVGQFIRTVRQLPPKTLIPQNPRRSQKTKEVLKSLAADSPYAHQAWMSSTPYCVPIEDWPVEVRTAFEKFRQIKKDDIRESTMSNRLKSIGAYVAYLQMDAEARLAHLPEKARQKLDLKRYQDDKHTIVAPEGIASLDDLFRLSHVQGFITWHAWRIHTNVDATVHERAPSKPSTRGKFVGESVLRLAQALKRKRDVTPIAAYLKHLPEPRKIHHKQAEYHRFSCAELDQVAKVLMDEARAMRIYPYISYQHPGAAAASRFAVGLVIMLGWRVPIRARNWCEALLDTNLRKVNGSWRWHFEGDELKIGKRRGETNVFDVKIPDDVVPVLEEYLHVWRPKLPLADTDRHLLLTYQSNRETKRYGMFSQTVLTQKLKVHVARLTGKRFFPHLLRTLFVSHAISEGLDPNSVAYFMNDTTATVLLSYNEHQAERHEEAVEGFYRRALNGHGR